MVRAKASKLEVLQLIRSRKMVYIYRLVEEFGYSYHYAEIRLYRLKKQGLALSDGKGCWTLTEEGIRRLRWLQNKAKQQKKGATTRTQ